jgi:beta-ribofuranosylaminobenzene 5'-phosphate synthase
MPTVNSIQPEKIGPITVEAPARLHLGFMDLNGSMGRRFGSVGLTLQDLSVRLHANASLAMQAEGPQAARALHYLHILHQELRLPGGVHMQIERAIPEHAGLGSGTQLAIAVGMAASKLYGLDFTAREIAFILDRGNRSGIGVGAFEHGGFLVDGGRGDGDNLPPLISRLDFPAAWRVLLILDRDKQGLHGGAEKQAFQHLQPFPDVTAAHLCRLVMMRALPALAEGRIEPFSDAIGELQQTVGDHFALAQGGRFTSRRVADVLEWLHQQGIRGIGQSSWGPTGFAIVESESRTQSLLRDLRQCWHHETGFEFMSCTARNRGGEVTVAQNLSDHTPFAIKSL